MTIDSSLNNELSVVHSVHNWLLRTSNWIYSQVIFLPPEVNRCVICDFTTNIAEFWVPNIYSLKAISRWRYYLDIELRVLGLAPRSGFLAQIARMRRANILHSHASYIAWENDRVARNIGLKHVLTMYAFDVNMLPTSYANWIDRHRAGLNWNDRYHTMFEHVDLVLCEGPHMAMCIAKRGCPRQKIEVQHLGVDLSKIRFRPRVWNPAKPLRVLIASRFTEKKGIPFALEALGRIQYEVPLEITIIGDASGEAKQQTEKQKILAVIKKHNLEPRIRMLGFQPYGVYLEEAYKHHVFLSPSVTASDGETEGGTNMAIAEMLASGMPVVSTRHCDIPETVQDGVSGLLANERDVDGLVKDLKWLVDHPEKWLSMADAGRRHMEKEYNAKVQGQRLASLYRHLVE
jgi:colanic acid/amylovoran biosynthesis glycosyltransferase